MNALQMRRECAANAPRMRRECAANKEGPVTYRGDVPLALFKNTEMVLPVLLLQVALLMI